MRYAEILLNRVTPMFVFDGLPDEIKPDFVARELIVHGRIGVTDKADLETYETPRAWRGYCGGEITAEYTGSRFIGASPVLGSCDFVIDETGVVIYNTTEDKFAPFALDGQLQSKRTKIKPPDVLPYTALYEYILRTAEQLEDIDTSLTSLLRTTRAMVMLTAKNEQIKAAAEQVLRKLYRGETDVVFTSDILDSLNFTFAPTANNAASILKELKEQYQFCLAQFYHAIGINANYNLKRERLNTAEIDLNEQPLIVNIADMEKCRKQGIEQINKMFGLSASVRLGDEWEQNKTVATSQPDNKGEGAKNIDGANDVKNVGGE